ncbi:MAG: hypothetical protein NTW74_25230 [Acidobacteria bacterium]|nr:hypothetical protein [Acidobacteriota bacterium]
MKKTGIALALILITGLGLFYYIRHRAIRDWEPLARERLITYLEERFDSKVEIGELDFNHLEGTRIEAIGKNFKLRFERRTDVPPIIAFDKITIESDIATLYNGPRVINRVSIEGLKITIPPRTERPKMQSSRGSILVETIVADGATLVILPSKAGKEPFDFALTKLTLKTNGLNQPYSYQTTLTIPKPPGLVTATGKFGPWNGQDPRQTKLDGTYNYVEADLGVFNGIDGTMASTGKFAGALETIDAEGECRVPNFRLTMAGNPVPLTVQYKALVDGADGDTDLKQIDAKLGSTYFTAKGEVVGLKDHPGRAIHLNVVMPKGNLKDILRLAMKGNQNFLEGTVNLKSSIDIPRGNVHVVEKLKLNGRFEIREANFTSDAIQDKIDGLAKRGSGRPKDRKMDNVPATFNGRFRMAEGKLDFEPVVFVVPGALVDLTGSYLVAPGTLDFRGSLNLDAKVSETFSGWKRWALKPFNPIFSKNDVGTYLPIKITGDKDNPQFGLARGGDTAPAGGSRRLP